MTKAGDDVEKRAAFRMPLKAGPHTITVAFLERTEAVNPPLGSILMLAVGEETLETTTCRGRLLGSESTESTPGEGIFRKVDMFAG